MALNGKNYCLSCPLAKYTLVVIQFFNVQNKQRYIFYTMAFQSTMNIISCCFLMVISCAIFLSIIECRTKNSDILSRKRRYLGFPDGSVFTVVYCLTSLTRLPANTEIISENINWSLAWELPNVNETLEYLHDHKDVAKRRNRRELYSKVENVLNSMGYNGRTCILKTLCEVGEKFSFKEHSLLYQLINIVFRFPGSRITEREPEEHKIYHWASTLNSREFTRDCSEVFKCPFSVVDFLLGEYRA